MTPLARRIRRLLPNLRRYTLALTGSRASGDAYVHAALEILLEEPSRIQPDGDLKFQLYALVRDVLRIFGPAWFERIDFDRTASYEEDPQGRSLAEKLRELPLLTRQLFLLVTLEDFSYDRAAELMDVPVREAEIHIAWARGHLEGRGRHYGRVSARGHQAERDGNAAFPTQIRISRRPHGGQFEMHHR